MGTSGLKIIWIDVPSTRLVTRSCDGASQVGQGMAIIQRSATLGLYHGVCSIEAQPPPAFPGPQSEFSGIHTVPGLLINHSSSRNGKPNNTANALLTAGKIALGVIQGRRW